MTSFAWVPGTLNFQIKFSEPVTGVSPSSFTIATTGSVQSSIAGVTPVDSSTYDVAFTYNNAPPGSIALSIKSSGSGITGQTSGLAYAGGGITMAVVPASPASDTTPPTVSSFTAGTASGSTVNFTLTFSEGVYGVTASNFTVNAANGASATVGNAVQPTNTAGTIYTVPVTFSGTGSITLTVQGNGTIKDGNNNAYAGTDTSAVFNLPGSTPTAPAITSATSASATVGTAFSYQIAASGSPTSYAATNLSGTGLSLNATTGVISGTPTAAGTITSQLTATNGAGTSAPVTLTISVAAANPNPGTGTAPTITSFALDSSTVTTSTGTFVVTFSAPVTGVDASDFALNTQGTASANITGVTPTSTSVYRVNFDYSGNSGSVQGAIKTSGTGIQDASGNAFVGGGVTASDPVPFTAAPAADVTNPTVSSFTAGTASGSTVDFTLTFSEPVTGVAASDFLVTAGSGVTATVGAVSGSGTTYTVPVTTTGSGTVQLTAIGGATTNIRDAATNWFAGGPGAMSAVATVGGSVTPTAPAITSATSASATVGTAFSYQITASGSPTSYAATNLAGTGLSLNATTGVISGTPTAAGTITSQLTATNATGTSAPVSLAITVATGMTAPAITSANGASATVGTAFSYQITASGSPTSFAATNLAGTGLSLNATTGVISGTPTAAGTITSQLTATNAAGTSAPVTLTIVVNSGTPAAMAPAVTSKTINVEVGNSFTYTVVATNEPTSYSMTGAPAGVSINAATGVISGTAAKSGVTIAVVKATNAAGTGSGTITFSFYTPGDGGGGGTTPPKSQTVTFASPVSAIIVGQPVALGATASSGLPIMYSIVSGDATVTGNTLVVNDTNPVVIRAAQAGNSTYAPASAQVTITAQKAAQEVTVSGDSTSTVQAQMPVKLQATASSGLPVTYTVVSGPATISGNTLTFTGTGTVTVMASQAGSAMYSSASTTLTYTAIPVTRLTNLSTRAHVSGNDADGATIAGFVVTGTAPKQMLIRAVGPGLSAYGVTDALADPTLKLFNSKGAVVATNSGWNNDANITAAETSVGAFKLASGSKDAAMLVTLAPGAYTAQVTSADSGTVLIEVYDVSANAPVPTKQLINISTRGHVGTAADPIIAGFAVSGTQPKQVLIRAVGPSLAPFGVSGTLANPMVELTDTKGNVIAKNDDWGTAEPVDSTQQVATGAQIAAAAARSGAFPLEAGSKDASILITLNPGTYTAIVTGAANSTGSALVEVYEVPNP